MISKEPKKVVLIDSSTRDVSVSETTEMARLRRENEWLQEKIKSLDDPWAYRAAGLHALKENRALEALGWFEKALVSDSSVISDDDMKQLPDSVDLKNGLVRRVITDVDKIPEIQKRYLEFGINVVIQGAVCFISGEYRMPDEIREMSALSDQVKFLCYRKQSTLRVCAFLGYEKTLKHLVDRGSGENLIENIGQEMLRAAGNCGHFGILKYLVEEEMIDIHRLDFFGQSVLYYAASSGNPLIVKYLIDEKGMDMNQEDIWHNTILFAAVSSGSVPMVKYLVEERGMDISQWSEHEVTILCTAARSGSLPMVKYLVEDKEMNTTHQDKEGRTILFAAAGSGSLPMVKYLVEEKRMDICQLNGVNETILFAATQSGSLPMVKYLVEERGMDILQLDFKKRTILFKAVAWISLHMVKYLVEEKRMNVHSLDKRRKNLLCFCGHPSIITYLLELGLRLTPEQRETLDKDRLKIIEKEEKAYGDTVGEQLYCGSNDADEKPEGENNEVPTVRSGELESEQEMGSERNNSRLL